MSNASKGGVSGRATTGGYSAGGGNSPGVHGAPPVVLWQDYAMLEEFAMKLQVDLEDAQAEVEDLNVELFEAMQVKDRTPGALLFFATMQDLNAVTALQQLELQLTQLKGFASCTEHVDFPTVRKRLNVCISTVPTLERFVKRYSNLHAKWTQGRFTTFKSRNLTGGDADESHTCPLCNIDSRRVISISSNSSSAGTNPVRTSTAAAGGVGEENMLQLTAERGRTVSTRTSKRNSGGGDGRNRMTPMVSQSMPHLSDRAMPFPIVQGANSQKGRYDNENRLDPLALRQQSGARGSSAPTSSLPPVGISAR